jgi:membrane-anchored protein YejM (alkaline phosphatase superfamily)
MVGSYYNYAVLEPDQVIITFPNGTFEVRDADYRIRKELQFRPEIMQAIATENKRFYR